MFPEENETLAEKVVDRMANLTSKRVPTSTYREKIEELQSIKTDSPPSHAWMKLTFPFLRLMFTETLHHLPDVSATLSDIRMFT